MRSPFRPSITPDPALLDDHYARLATFERRGLIRCGLSLGTLALLTGCDLGSTTSVEGALRAVSNFNDSVQGFLFSPTRLARPIPRR